MRIAVAGGGPGGLYFAALARQLLPDADITVWERNSADDTFGFGVVFSDETLGGIENADPVIYRQMEREFARWDDIDVHYRGEVITSGGHGFAAMSRRRLLEILQQRCAGLGVQVLFRTHAPSLDELAASHDLVVAADGANSAIRSARAAAFRPEFDVRNCKYMWLGTDLVFDAFKFFIEPMPSGGRPDSASSLPRPGIWRPASRTRPRSSASRASSAACSASTPCWPITRAGSASPRCPAGAATPGTSSCSATPPIPRTSRSARAPSSPWRTRLRWQLACTRTPATATPPAAFRRPWPHTRPSGAR